MEEVKELVRLTRLSGYDFIPKGEQLIVKNGKTLPEHLKGAILDHKEDILFYLENEEDVFQ